ncbi:MAG TPA: hypothetical protein VKF14_03505 [Candidatus Dormibacteraeota bacterium]|nr:hypothetical protein [Candidatus Dormibacteraeota bacterium]
MKWLEGAGDLGSWLRRELRRRSGKGMAGLVVAVLAVGGSAVAATGATGSANPAAWGQHVFASQHSDKQGASGAHDLDRENCQEDQNEAAGDNDDKEGPDQSNNDSDKDEAAEQGCDNDRDEANEPHHQNDTKAAKHTGDHDEHVTESTRGKDDSNGGDHGHTTRPSPK